MGRLVEGVWQEDDVQPADKSGRFVREDTVFRNKVTRDGSSGFPAVANRYHLYVSLACPWAHRTLIMRKLKKLEDAISVSIVDPKMGNMGWEFSENPGCIPDFVNNCRLLQDVYLTAKTDYTGRVTVPILWDKEARNIVSNESSDIILMMNSEFDCADNSVDYYPASLKHEIDEINEFVYHNINNGVYKSGFANTQEAYDEAVGNLFNALDKIETVLDTRRYLVGDQITVADIRLFTTLIRFDIVYHYHFKCNIRRIEDYHNLSNYVRDLYQIPEIGSTVNFDHYIVHYFWSHYMINPFRIIPAGPNTLDYERPHDRDKFKINSGKTTELTQ
jgi:putative glutathione S-transferase